MDIQERLKIFYARLEAAPAAGTAEEAMNLVCRTINGSRTSFVHCRAKRRRHWFFPAECTRRSPIGCGGCHLVSWLPTRAIIGYIASQTGRF
jgi:hypothetical protein